MTWQPENDLEAQRLAHLEEIRALGVEAFPGHQVQRSHTIAQAVAAYLAVEVIDAEGHGASPQPIPVTLCGRVMAHRPQGKAIWLDIDDGSGRVQAWLKADALDAATFALFREQIDLFDFVQISGTMMRTRRGEVTALADAARLLSKALSPLPVIKERELEDGSTERYGGFTDPEARYRERYADLAVNPDVREVFRTRARTLSAIRRFFDERGFLEVETPILQPIYGGAAARPFVTHHNKLDQDMYLRISFELYLKRLLVGMYDAVYEIGRDFRNEGVSKKHNPEFTQIEFYKAYIDYNGVMELTEQMVAYVAQQVTGGTQISYQGHQIELAPPWRRLTLRQAVLDHAGVDYMASPVGDAAALAASMQAKGLEANPGKPWGELVGDLLDEAEPHLIQPTFVIDYPAAISPFAKKKPGHPSHTERFEFFIAGLEMGNAFTELNDPLDQEARFIEMGRVYAEDSDDYHPVDEDYLHAMRYGMPPNGGFGMGIDRLVMLLTDRPNIREVLLFPALRAKED